MRPQIMPMPRLPDGRRPVITSGYGPRKGGLYDFHYGIDLFYPRLPHEPLTAPVATANGKWTVPNGVPAVAVADGVVTKSSWTNTGDRVRIDHGDGWASGYMHLRARKVKVGDRVKAGDILGEVSFSPWKTGYPKPLPPPAPPPRIGLNHLHFELYKNEGTVAPEAYIKNLPAIEKPSAMPWLLAGVGAVVLGVIASRFIA